MYIHIDKLATTLVNKRIPIENYRFFIVLTNKSAHIFIAQTKCCKLAIQSFSFYIRIDKGKNSFIKQK